MKLENVKLSGLKIIRNKVFNDDRGFFREIYKSNLIENKFVFDVMSHSRKNVLRGMHIQTMKPQAKIITVTQGTILDVVVDLRKKSKTFGNFFSLKMSYDSDFSFYIPVGFAHGFLCLSEKCTVNYKCSNYRHEKSETTLAWNDDSVGIKWPIKNPVLSEKDKNGKNLNFFK